jgi:hypothetical protein
VASTVERFIKLFRGRGDARGSWGGPAIREPVTPEHFERHIHSADQADWFGVYNVIGTRCSWGCVDIDTDDYPLAQNIRNALGVRGIVSWIEKTARGFHVWVFPEEPLVDAATMRRALTAACHAVHYVPKEVFPKQTKVTAGGLGNFVRLPYNGWLAEPHYHQPRFIVGHVGYAELFDDALDAVLADMDNHRASTSTLQALADLLPEPQGVHVAVDTHDDSPAPVEALNGLAYTIWRDGPLEGEDRSDAMVRLAYLMSEQDLPPDDAWKVLRSADLRWGKHFIERGEQGNQIMLRILAKGYR